MMEDVKRDPSQMTQLLLTGEEIDALAVAVAKFLEPLSAPQDAFEASVIIWGHEKAAGPILCSLATLMAEARI